MEAPKEILECVRRAIGRLPRKLQSPVITEQDRANAAKCDPDVVELFEDDLCALTKAKHAIALASGTAALHLALVCAGVKAGDEVLVPSLTFAATAHAIIHAGAAPHFVDIREIDLGINPFKLKQYIGDRGFFQGKNGQINNLVSGRGVTAIMPVHLLGLPCEAAGLAHIAKNNTMSMVEDSAEALGGRTWSGKYCGTIGRAGVFSFNLNKIVTTGGGGAIVTDDSSLASTARHLMQQAKIDHRYHWTHDRVGWNYRMPAMCAALGLGQLRRLHRTLEKKHDVAERYRLCFADCKSAKLITGTGNDWLNAIALHPNHLDKRDEVIELLLANGYESRALFTPLHTLEYLKKYPRQGNMACTEYMFKRVICLPSSIEPAI